MIDGIIINGEVYTIEHAFHSSESCDKCELNNNYCNEAISFCEQLKKEISNPNTYFKKNEDN